MPKHKFHSINPQVRHTLFIHEKYTGYPIQVQSIPYPYLSLTYAVSTGSCAHGAPFYPPDAPFERVEFPSPSVIHLQFETQEFDVTHMARTALAFQFS